MNDNDDGHGDDDSTEKIDNMPLKKNVPEDVSEDEEASILEENIP